MTDHPDFDRFLLQGTIPEEEKQERYTGVFSFSSYKYSLFHFCRKAWYFHYILAQGGWDRYAEDSSRQAYKEKYLLSFSAFLSGIVISSIKESLPVIREEEKEEKRRDALLDAVRFHASKHIFYANNFLREGGMENDPRKLSFSDLYYRTGRFENTEDLIENSKDVLRGFFLDLPETEYFRSIAFLPSPAWHLAGKFPSFSLDGLPIYLAPCLYALSGGFFYRFPVYFHDHPQKEDGLLSADGLFGLYAANQYPGHRGKIHCVYYQEQEKLLTEKSFLPSPAEKENIFSAAKEMMELMQDPQPENFSYTEKKERCSFCRFRGICHKLQNGGTVRAF
ncbi:MAG: hypothetical protein IKA79_06105 [Lentisphaeria bacterium]|nr:hypothetical protein [Lentisphaeria bacterium]